MVSAAASSAPLSRVDLFRLLADEGRLRLLALAAEEELSVGELAELLQESQPQVSRKAAPLRSAGLLESRREGTRTFLRAARRSSWLQDPVVQDALHEGHRLAQHEGSFARIAEVLAQREQGSRDFFAGAADDASSAAGGGAAGGDAAPAAGAWLASLFALAPLLPARRMALDVGTGEGHALDVLAPLYERVLALDTSRARLARAARRADERGFRNVRFLEGSFDSDGVREEVDRHGGADLLFAGRLLHHVARPALALASFARCLRPGGHLVLLDYLAHDDEQMRQDQADVWLGFDLDDVTQRLDEQGLTLTCSVPVPERFRSPGPDAHLRWQTWVAQKM